MWIERLSADRLGVDDEGHLWTWTEADGRVVVYGAGGEEVAETRVPGALEVDVDRRWGVLSLHSVGFEVRRTPLGEGEGLSLRLEDQASAVAWIDRATAAVAPDRAAYRVELWDVERGFPIRRLGNEETVPPEPGARFVRAMQLDYHPGSRLLYTLESLTGDFQILDLAGGLLHRARVDNPRVAEFEAWLAEADRKARAQGDHQRPAIVWFRMALDATGVAWTVQSCEPETGSGTLLRLPPTGEVETLELASGCCSKRLAVWRDWIVLYQTPGSSGTNCLIPRR